MIGQTPHKPFELVLAVESEPDKVLNWGSDLSCLLDAYKQAIKDARAATKQDGQRRWVSLRHILAVDAIQ